MNRNSLTSVIVALLALVGIALVASAGDTSASSPQAQAKATPQPGRPGGPQTQQGSAFTYQGRLLSAGNPANGQYDLVFRLYDSVTAGNLVGDPSVITLTNQTLTDGLYSVTLDFGATAFKGQERWLEMAVQPVNGPGYTTLLPRQSLKAAPYASGLMPGAVVTGTTSSAIFSARNDGTGYALYAESPNGTGVFAAGRGYGLRVTQSGDPNGAAIFATSDTTHAVVGQTSAANSAGVEGRGFGAGGIGVAGISNADGYGVTGRNNSATRAAIDGRNTGTGGVGIYGETYAPVCTQQPCTPPVGVKAFVFQPCFPECTTGYALYASGGSHAGYFQGNVHVNGTLSKSAGSFKIDHPLDPENKYLYHSFVESPDMMNVYNGNITTDAKGQAVVTLPSYFDALNKDFRYQLTIMGDQFAQARVSSKIKDSRFTIMTDKPNIEVSWQVTGIRKDRYAEENRIPVEVNKSANERGYYLHPELYGQPESKSADEFRRDPAPRPTPTVNK